MIESDCHQFTSGHACVYSTVSPDKDGANEDAAVLIERDNTTLILAVADGLGGQPSGDQASEITVRQLASASSGLDKPDVRASILDGIEQANNEITGLGTGSATTLAATEIQDNQVRPYHVGDSMILIVGQRGKIKLQTIAHSPVSYAVEAGLLDEGDAIHHQERHLVSNIVGSTDMRIEVGSQLALSARDTLLLATDGLFDNLHIPEIVDIIRKGSLEKAAQTLAARGKKRMEDPGEGMPSKPDDLTFILYRPI